VFASTLFVRMRTSSPYLRVRYSCVCVRRARVCVYGIREDSDECPMFACTLFVRIRTNSPCWRVCYSCGCGGTAHVCVFAIGAYGDEKILFRCTSFVSNRANIPFYMFVIRVYAYHSPVCAPTVFFRIRTNSPCLRLRFSFVCRRIARVCVYAIRAYTDV